MEDPSPCRCGHPADSEQPHPCHGKGYTCGKPATHRIYNPYLASLAGVQMKTGAESTWACDACWEWYLNLRRNLLTQES